MITIEQQIYGMLDDGQAVIIYTMTAPNGSSVELCNLGATLLGAKMPDRTGKIEDVVLGYPNLEQMMRDNACASRTVGRVANRTADGKMTIEGKEYLLEINNGRNHLHGGSNGFSKRVWESRVETNRVVMTLHSEDGDQGYPAAVDVEAIFDFDDQGALEITYRAVSDGTTVVNLTNHAYFNLGGVGTPTIFDHELKLNATTVLEFNEFQIPTGERLPLEGSSMDLRDFLPLGKAVEGEYNRTQEFRGLDHYFEIDGYKPSILAENAILRHPQSGRTLTVLSSAPGLMVYTGNYLGGGSPITKSGKGFNDYEGVALECQIHPNAINTPAFPSILLKAGELYCQKIVFKFGTY